ncbi:beta-ketoacyl synthase [Streptomyces venezuelae]|uniref:Beta-ketoacyl synthase n=1 Tax=Streptomyces venezuelae TaxID=54571 RepID=A0A5P2CSV4_STRVZ|nr:type I polyketide synthase [Streptomyces venezuelae]QES45503.1 beta-ketoacyl synthase [Streptomyces venezuelae]
MKTRSGATDTPAAPEGPSTAIAIIGMAVLLPGAPDLDTYWRNLVTGTDAITQVPAHRWDASLYPDRIYCRRGGFVDDIASVDAAGFGVMPDSVPGTEPDQLIALQVAARAIADAGGEASLPQRDRIGVVLGRGGYLTPAQARNDQRVRTARQLVHTLAEVLPELDAPRLARIEDAFARQLGPDRPESAIGLVPNLAASRIANRLDLRGPAYTTDAACASSLIAVDQAVAELTTGRCDMMLAGGVHHCHDVTLWSVFSRLGALSPSERSRPFHARADGILIGEGTGIVVLKRLADATRDGDRVYAVIRGTGVAADGRAASLVSPDPGGQARAVRQAWQAAGLDPREPGAVGLLEAHGTGTPAGDAAELATLTEVFGPPHGYTRDASRPGVIGSVKSMIGHTMPAAGVAGLVKVALALHHATLPPTLHCEDPHPALAATRFQPLGTAQPWDVDGPGGRDAPDVRRAAVNAFGFGGINAHVVLEEAPRATGTRSRTASTTPAIPTAPTNPTVVHEPEPVLRLTADSPELLADRLDAPDAALRAHADAEPPSGGRMRLAIVAPDARRLALARRAVAKGSAWRGRGDVWFSPEPLLAPGAAPGAGSGTGIGGKLAFVFPGLEAEFAPQVGEVARHFGIPLPPPLSMSMSMSTGADAVVGDVGRHGVGVLAVGRVLDGALRALGVEPDAVAGHSIGEWSAMLAGGLYDTATADALLADFDPDALRVPGVAFAAIGASAEQVSYVLGPRTDVVLSHDNAPTQSMICGPKDAVDALVEEFRARRTVAQLLPFRSGFHTPMLAPYLRPLTAGVHRAPVRAARVPVWSGTTAAPFPAAADDVRDLFVRHLLEPVRFRPLIDAMYAAGFRAFAQVGTGRLSSLIEATLAGREGLTVAADTARCGGLAQLRRVVAALWTAGSDRATFTPLSRRTAARRRPVRLDLGAASVSLPPDVRAEIRADLLSALHPTPTPRPTRPDRLDALATLFPAAAELRSALTETVDAALTVFTGAATRHRPEAASGSRPPAAGEMPEQVTSDAVECGATAPAPRPTAASPFTTAAPAGAEATPRPQRHPHPQPPTARPVPVAAGAPTGADPAARATAAEQTSVGAPNRPEPPPEAPRAAQPPAPQNPRPASAHGAEPAPLTTATTPLTIDTTSMPHLLDHCFIPQRPGWPDLSDRHPVVPATAVVHHMSQAVERARPGQRVVAVHDVRLEQWLVAEPATRVEVVVTSEPDERLVRVAFGPYARAVLEVADNYPSRPPARWRREADERPCPLTAEALYRDRWMFHGPAYQGLTELTGIGDRHVRGIITAPAAPGALLDNVGQLLGHWILATHTDRNVVFPVRMHAFRFFGPHPAPGTPVECHVGVTSLTGTALTADVQLTVAGTVWAEITGWQDRRFDVPGADRPGGYPEHRTLSEIRPGGWTLLTDSWPDPASRDLVMRTQLGAAERAVHRTHPPRGRRQWLLGRIAAKDAVRHRLWQQSPGEAVYPAEIAIRNDSAGRPYAVGVHGRELPALDLSLAHRAETAVALVRPRAEREHPESGVGIDIEVVAERSEATYRAALDEGERALLAGLGAAGGGERDAVWFTRFWAAKEAAAKAEGSGLRGRPRGFAVRAVRPHGLIVETERQRHHVRCEHLASTPAPTPAAPVKDHIVAWTVKENDL